MVITRNFITHQNHAEQNQQPSTNEGSAHQGCHRQPNEQCDCEHCKKFSTTANNIASNAPTDDWGEVDNNGWTAEPLGLPDLQPMFERNAVQNHSKQTPAAGATVQPLGLPTMDFSDVD